MSVEQITEKETLNVLSYISDSNYLLIFARLDSLEMSCSSSFPSSLFIDIFINANECKKIASTAIFHSLLKQTPHSKVTFKFQLEDVTIYKRLVQPLE